MVNSRHKYNIEDKKMSIVINTKYLLLCTCIKFKSLLYLKFKNN